MYGKRSVGLVGVLILASLLTMILHPAAAVTPSLAQGGWINDSCEYGNLILSENPLAYWRLGETSGTTAINLGSVGNAVDGTYQSGVSLGEPGLVDSDPNPAASFDGVNGYVAIPNHAQINATGPYYARTIELWFKADVLTGKQILYEEGGATNGLNIFLDDNELYVGAWAYDAGGTGQWVHTTVVADTPNHVALVFNGTAQTIAGYLNGASLGTQATDFGYMPSHTAGIGIGAINDDTRYPEGGVTPVLNADHYAGVIDEIAVYDFVLTPDRVQRHANGCTSQMCDYQATLLTDAPAAYWRLGERSGSIAFNMGSIGPAVNGTYQSGVGLGAMGLVPGDPNTAASFDGMLDYVNIPSDNEINTGGPYGARTIELWFNADAPLTGAGTQVLYEQGGIHNGFNIFLDDDQLTVGAWTGDTGHWISTTVLDSASYHVALVFDGATSTLTGYLNGTSFGAVTPTAFDAVDGHIGLIAVGGVQDETRFSDSVATPPGQNGFLFEGNIDEVALYNSVLSPERIQAHATSCSAFPQLESLDLQQSLDKTDWGGVEGNLNEGFVLSLDTAVEFYYFNAANVMTNQSLVPGYYGFAITCYPLGFFEYWAARGVVEGASDWMGVMWEIVNGRLPTFYLRVTDDGMGGQDYMLVDGLLHALGAPDEYLRIDGSYWVGTYCYAGTIVGELGEQSTVDVDITFESTPTAVGLVSFLAAPALDHISLQWETATELDNLGFNLYRSESLNSEPTLLNPELVPAQRFGSPAGTAYEYLDRTAQGGVLYYYWLEGVDVYGQTTRYGPESARIQAMRFLPLLHRNAGPAR